MLNIYGETVKLTPAQKREYVSLLDGPVFVNWKSRRYPVLEALKNKGLVKVMFVIGNATRYGRWM